MLILQELLTMADMLLQIIPNHIFRWTNHVNFHTFKKKILMASFSFCILPAQAAGQNARMRELLSDRRTRFPPPQL